MKTDQTYRKYQRFIQTLLALSGCSYMPTRFGRIAYYWSVLSLLVAITYTILSLHASYVHRHNLAIMMKYIGVATSALGTLLKVAKFMTNRDSMIIYHRTINDLFESEYIRNEKIQAIMFSSLPPITIIAYIYSMFILALMVTYVMPAYSAIFRGLYHWHLTTDYILPVTKGYGYFWTVPDNFWYHFHLLYETVDLLLSCLVACGVDTAFGFYAYQLAAILDAMYYRLTNPLPTENFSDTLRTCATKHKKLLLCRDILEHMYAPIVLWHIVSNAILLCALIYEVSSQQFSEFKIIYLCVSASYAMIKFLQTFSYAWHGTILTDAGEKLRKGLYFSEWHKSRLDRHVRTNVILMMMQKPMTIHAYFASVDMILFTNFVNTTVSYFFLMQSVGDKNE
ncbi:hypothetical protein PUN28_016970 [Cardiocondyla obscurior]|uniref:Odorant receptor n=1 Tax=Cardiocondyla obscurior TaxID=286306 RepID=A0AAW2EJR5_9HYME